MPRKNFKDLRDDLADRVGEERVAAAEEAERDRYALEELALGDVRRARSLTQTQLARTLGVSQAQVSRIESQTDLFLSTLASYIEAMGGELSLIATFPEGKSVALDIGDPTSEPDFVGMVSEELGLPRDVVAAAQPSGATTASLATVRRRTQAFVRRLALKTADVEKTPAE